MEDLANKFIYEIFEYLDSYDTYLAFFNLNYRFRSLVQESNSRSKINIPLMFQKAFKNYNHEIETRRMEHHFLFDEYVHSQYHRKYFFKH